MKRFNLILLPVMIIMILMVGCAKETPTPEPTNTPTPTEEPATNTPEPSPTPTDEPTKSPTEEPTETPTDVPPTATTQSSGGGGSNPTPTESSGGENPTATSAPPTPTQADVPDMVPDGQSVWQLDNDPYEKYSTDACVAPLNVDFYGLVAVNKVNDGVITWTVPDGTTYTLQRTDAGKNSYWGIGRSTYGGHDLWVAVYFASTEGLGVTYTMVDDTNNDCKHVFKYNGARAW